MKLRYFLLFSAFIAVSGCSSSTVSNPDAFDFTQINNEYLHNVSDLDGVATSGEWNVDIIWKDSNGKLDSLSSFPPKVVLLSFWNTTSDSAFAEESTLDSAQTDLGDSVVIVSVASFNSSTISFHSIDSFVVAHNIKHQVVVDSSERAQLLYFGSNNAIGFPAVFTLQPNGQILNNHFIEGWANLSQLDSLVRAAYR